MRNKETTNIRPYEKFEQYGAQSLTDCELLAVILRTGTREENAEDLASRILTLAGCDTKGLSGLHRISMEQLLQIKGIGKVKAIQIKCAIEFCTRMAKSTALQELVFNRSGSVAAYYMESLRHQSRECVYLLLLDTKGHLIREIELSKGTVKASMLSPREVFVEAFRAEAVNMILLHNHPSGDPTPSRDDVEISITIAEMGKKMDLLLIDHIIIGDNKYVSLKEKGYL